MVILSLYSSRAQLLSLTLSLESLGKQSFNFTPLDRHQVSSPGAYLSPTSFLLSLLLVTCGRLAAFYSHEAWFLLLSFSELSSIFLEIHNIFHHLSSCFIFFPLFSFAAVTYVQFSRSVMSDSLWPHELQHARPPCPSPTPRFTQTHIHRVGDAIQPSHPRSSPFPPVPNPSQHQRLFQRVNSSHQVAKVLEFQL